MDKWSFSVGWKAALEFWPFIGEVDKKRQSSEPPAMWKAFVDQMNDFKLVW